MRHARYVPIALALAAPATAQEADSADRPTPAAYQSVLDCRTTADPAQRLTCYDRAVADLALATAARDVIVVDKATVERAERERFGSPTMPALAGTNGEALDELATTVTAVSYTPFGKLIIGLPDGASWVQLDSREVALAPRIGTPVTLRKAALGSYLVNINGQTAIRMRRLERRR